MSRTIKAMTTALLAFVLLPLSAQDRDTAGYVPESMAAFDLPWLVKYYDSGLSLPDCAPEDLARADSVATDVDLQEDLQGCKTSPVKGPYTFSLRANLLRWATLTPDLGVEWRISPSVGILVNGSWTSWTSWPSKDLRASHPRKGDY